MIDPDIDVRTLKTPKQAAEILGIKVSTLARYRAQRIGPVFYRVGGKPFYNEFDLHDYHMEKGRPPGAKVERIETHRKEGKPVEDVRKDPGVPGLQENGLPPISR